MTEITMEDIKKLDCEICGLRMNWIKSDDGITIKTYCDDRDHPEYEYNLIE